MLGRVVQKLLRDRAESIVIAPIWLTQSWHADLLQLVIYIHIILPMRDNVLTMPHTDKVRPLQNILMLMACRVSGNHLKVTNFLKKQQTSYLRPGDMELKHNTQHILVNGHCTVVKNKLLHFSVL